MESFFLEPIYKQKIYNNTILAVWGSLDVLDEPVQAFYRDTYQQTRTESPVQDVRTAFDIYIVDRKLVYVRETCDYPQDVEKDFFLHVIPVDKADVPAHHKRKGFDNLDFDFHEYGVRFDGKCMLVVPLPEYEIDHIRTGQFLLAEQLWKAVFPVQQERLTARLASVPRIIASDSPVIASAFDVYLHENKLVYVKAPCTEKDTKEKRFFLHVFPSDVNSLSEDRKEHGFDNLDFGFSQYGRQANGRCMAVTPLPAYDIAGVRTGQYTSEGVVWEGEIPLNQRPE